MVGTEVDSRICRKVVQKARFCDATSSTVARTREQDEVDAQSHEETGNVDLAQVRAQRSVRKFRGGASRRRYRTYWSGVDGWIWWARGRSWNAGKQVGRLRSYLRHWLICVCREWKLKRLMYFTHASYPSLESVWWLNSEISCSIYLHFNRKSSALLQFVLRKGGSSSDNSLRLVTPCNYLIVSWNRRS